MAYIEYELRPLPSRALRGWHRVWSRIEQAATWVRRGAFLLVVAVVLYNAACGGTTLRT